MNKLIMRIIETLRQRRLLKARRSTELAEHILLFSGPRRYFEAEDQAVIFEEQQWGIEP